MRTRLFLLGVVVFFVLISCVFGAEGIVVIDSLKKFALGFAIFLNLLVVVAYLPLILASILEIGREHNGK